MDDKPNSQAARDIAYYFHPATNARRHEEIGPTIMERGKGVYVYDDQGKEYIEGLAGLWSVAVGFGEERLVRAATRQMQKLPYYHSFNHKSHPVAIDLAERLVKMAPKGLAKVQFTSSGSEANDFAIKLLWYYNNAIGRPQKKKIHLAPARLSRRDHRGGKPHGLAHQSARFRPAAADDEACVHAPSIGATPNRARARKPLPRGSPKSSMR